MYEFELVLTEEELIKFQRHHFAHAPAARKSIAVFRALVPVLLFCCVMIFCINDPNPQGLFTTMAIFGLISIAWILLVPSLFLFSIKHRIRSAKKRGKLLTGKISRIRFDENTYYDTTDETDVSIKYTKIDRIESGDSTIYICFGENQAVLLPQRIFASPTQQDEFWRFIHEKWREAKKEQA